MTSRAYQFLSTSMTLQVIEHVERTAMAARELGSLAFADKEPKYSRLSRRSSRPSSPVSAPLIAPGGPAEGAAHKVHSVFAYQEDEETLRVDHPTRSSAPALESALLSVSALVSQVLKLKTSRPIRY